MLSALLTLALLLPQPQDEVRKEVVVSDDGLKSVSVHFYQPPYAGAPNIVIVHDWGGSKDNWADIAQILRSFGHGVVLFDLRGHSDASIAYYYFTDEQVAEMLEDVALVVKYAREKGSGPVHIMGAGLGANLAIIASAIDGRVGKVVAISPGLNYRGLKTAEAMEKLDPERVLLLAGQEDIYSVYSTRELKRLYQVERKLYQSAGHGVWMLKRQNEILDDIIKWLR